MAPNLSELKEILDNTLSHMVYFWQVINPWRLEVIYGSVLSLSQKISQETTDTYPLFSKYYNNHEVKIMFRNTIASSKTTAISTAIRLKNKKESNLNSFKPINLTITLFRSKKIF